MSPLQAPYGAWRSPITSALIVSETIGLGQLAFDGDDLYWTESRPTEGGRIVVVRHTRDGLTADVTPPDFNARTRVHEYGGGAFAVAGGTVYFSNFVDQRLYRQDPGAAPRPITPDTPGAVLRYADFHVDARRGRLICVREDHRTNEHEPVNTIVSLPLAGMDEGQVLAEGNNFYASPSLSADGQRLAYLTWNHPNMPWDGCELWVADLAPGGALGTRQSIAGGLTESVFQPIWAPDGSLYFASDRTGWWNLYRWRAGQVEPLCPMEAEFGAPQWIFGFSTYAQESAGRLICSYTRAGTGALATLDTRTLAFEPIELPYTWVSYVHAAPGRAAFLAGSAAEAVSLVTLDLDEGEPAVTVLRRSHHVSVDAGYVSVAQPVAFPTEDGLTAHGLFYAPHNRDYAAPEDERPPLIVESHGGPTGAYANVFNLQTQYWTSRGFGVLLVNYGGSTGYGRAYRERLNGQWGIVDVDDCVNGARYLVERGLVDGQRLIIRGGSAGGYTTLCALTFRDTFKAGASYFGIGDLEAMARDTHKFESRYLDGLIGPYPERQDLYRERSPIHFAERIACPMILFQGLEDRVVPPNQAEQMVEALRARGLPFAYVAFEGEGHGFRRAENLKRCLDAELYFYARVFGFPLADPVEPVAIENLDG